MLLYSLRNFLIQVVSQFGRCHALGFAWHAVSGPMPVPATGGPSADRHGTFASPFIKLRHHPHFSNLDPNGRPGYQLAGRKVRADRFADPKRTRDTAHGRFTRPETEDLAWTRE
jgi:hypothetical protein